MTEPGLFIRLYLDADVDVKLAAYLRHLGYECTSSREVGRAALDDEGQFRYAADIGCVLVTHNIQHFVPIFERWWRSGQSHPGLVVSEQVPLGEMQRRLVRLLDTVTADEMRDNIRNLAEFAERL